MSNETQGIKTSAAKQIIDRLLTVECPYCKQIGRFCLSDVIKIRRTWLITKDGIDSESVNETQIGAEAYSVHCTVCRVELELEDNEDVDDLAEEKDTL